MQRTFSGVATETYRLCILTVGWLVDGGCGGMGGGESEKADE